MGTSQLQPTNQNGDYAPLDGEADAKGGVRCAYRFGTAAADVREGRSASR